MKTNDLEQWQDLPDLLTVKEVAGLLRVHVNTIYNWIHSGYLPAHRVGRTWRIQKEDAWVGRDA